MAGNGKMTAAERSELGSLVRFNAKVARADAEARGKWLKADVEEKLSARFKFEDAAWKDITAAAEKAVQEADAAIAALCRDRGVPEDFRPSLCLSWHGRGENASAARRAEMRKLAYAHIDAQVKEMQVEIDRQAAQQLNQLAQAGLNSEAARAFIDALPSPEELLKPLVSIQMDDGELVALEAPAAVTAVTGDGGGVTASRNVCAFCGQAFQPTRRDSKYCSTAHRVADYRKRQKPTD